MPKVKNKIRDLFAIGRKRPAITFVVPVYNKEAHLRECLQSIFNQRDCDIEVVCVDDASTDNSARILCSFAKDRRLISVKNQANFGPGPARNRGLLYASGQYVRFVDADDILPTTSSARLLSLAAVARTPLVRGNIARLAANRPSRVIKPVSDEGPIAFSTRPNLRVPWYFTTYLFERSALACLGMTFPDLRLGEDAVFLAGLLCQSPLVLTTSEVVYNYRARNPRAYTAAEFKDYVLHALLVENIFYRYHYTECWEDYRQVFFHSADRVLAKLDTTSQEVQRSLRLLNSLKYETAQGSEE